MAKKPRVNKTQAVRDYLKDHPGAWNKEIAAALTKQGIKITTGHVANIKASISKARTTKKASKKPAWSRQRHRHRSRSRRQNGGTITLMQIKLVAATIKTLGGYERLSEVLAVIKELGRHEEVQGPGRSDLSHRNEATFRSECRTSRSGSEE